MEVVDRIATRMGFATGRRRRPGRPRAPPPPAARHRHAARPRRPHDHRAGRASGRQPAHAAPAGRPDRGRQPGHGTLRLGRLEGRARRRPRRAHRPRAPGRDASRPGPTGSSTANRELMEEVRQTGLPSVSLQPPHVIVAAPDRPGLFSSVAGALALNGMDVRAANVSGEDGVAVEVFTVEVARGTWPDTAKLREDLAAVLSDRLALGERLSERERVYPLPARLGRPPARQRRQRRQRGLRDRHRLRGPGPRRDRPARTASPGPSSRRTSTWSRPGSPPWAKWSWTPSTSGSPDGAKVTDDGRALRQSRPQLRPNWAL